MYTYKGKTYSSPGHALQLGAMVGFEFHATAGITEHKAGAISVYRGTAVIADACAVSLKGITSYAQLKAKLVKLRYSNDDQIAVMLNADPDEMARMQAWREWAAATAKEICRQAGID